MSASSRASDSSCVEHGGSGRAAPRPKAVHAAVLVYPKTAFAADAAISECEDVASAQACALERALPRGWRIFAAVGGEASTVAALRSAAALGPRRLVIVSMDPWSRLTVPPLRLHSSSGDAESPLEVRDGWSDESSLIDLHARCIREVAMARGLSPRNAVLVLRARSSGEHLQAAARTAALIAARLGWPQARVKIQAGDSLAAGEEFAEGSTVLLHEMDLWPAPRAQTESACSVCPHKVMAMLSALIRRGRHPMADPPPPLFSWAGVADRAAISARLVMIGVSIAGALGPGDGPPIRYCDAEAFRALKRPHGEVVDLLISLRGGAFREVLVWNTCNRLELYGWLDADASSAQVREAIGDAADALLGDAAGSANVVYGRRAFQHLLRTATGLNSALAGDAEVLDQLESARRTAEHAGTAGERTSALLHEAAEAVHRLREQTPWSEFAHRYCEIALGRLKSQMHGALKGRCTVIGGSTTGASVLEMLRGPLGAIPENLTLIYRGQRSGSLTRRLHAAAAGGRILNVESYADAAVMDEIARADAIFLTGDHREPVVRGRELASRRDVAARPILVVDFNTLGSTQGLERLEGVRLISAERIEQQVAAFNREVVTLERFQSALGAAEDYIAQCAGVAPRRAALDAQPGPWAASPCSREEVLS